MSLGGIEKWKGRSCPGALLDDPFVRSVFETYWPLEHWHQLPLPGAYGDQPNWWGQAMATVKATFAQIEHERLDRLEAESRQAHR